MDKDQVLTLKHYKEPLLAVKKGDGFGYYGALSVTIDGTKVQCHICGNLFEDMGTHARQKHRISHNEYREKFKLAYQTSLISEKVRENRKQMTLLWLASLTKKEKAAYQANVRRRYQEWIKAGKPKKEMPSAHMLETKNKRGTCPDQLLAKIHEVAKTISHTPTLAEFITETGGQRYKHLILKTFGSWNQAIKMSKLTPHEPTGVFVRHTYSDEELLEYLHIYAQENNSIPTATDSKRGLIPDFEVYQRRFGTFEHARERAGVYDIVPKTALRGVTV